MSLTDQLLGIGRDTRGEYGNPIQLEGLIPEEWPTEFAHRRYLYVVPKGGSVTKWYRSYEDYVEN